MHLCENLRIRHAQGNLFLSADADRPLTLTLQQAHEPWTILGEPIHVAVGTEWQNFSGVFGPSDGDAAARLLFTGLGGAAFSIMQATLVYLSAPPEMRSRVLGVLSVCIGVGPIGFVALGWLADAIGAPWATAAAGFTGLLAMLLTRPLWRVI